MPGFADIASMFGGGGGGAPWGAIGKGAGTAMESTGRGFASLSPKISGAISGAAAGEHQAYQRMAHKDYQDHVIDNAHGLLGNDIQRGKALFGGGGVAPSPSLPQMPEM